MTVSFYIEGWKHFPKEKMRSYADDEFPGIEIEFFVDHPEYEIQNGRAFTIKDMYEEGQEPYTLSMTNSSVNMMFDNLGFKDKLSLGKIKGSDLDDLIQRLETKIDELSLNKESRTGKRETSDLPATYDFAFNKDYRDIHRVATIARKNNAGIFLKQNTL